MKKVTGINICPPKQISQRKPLEDDEKGIEHSKQSVNSPVPAAPNLLHESLFAG